MDERAERAERRCDAYRRAFEVMVSAVLAITVIPIVVVAAVGSAISLRAWPFFVQQRVGKDGELFRFVKVRTLPIHIPRYIDKYQLDHQHIPAFCRALRRLHLDELPQLLLVLRGRMSLVGPRPEMAYLHEQLPHGFAELRVTTRPGCTGLWQISHACSDLIGAAPEYDRFYLEHRSLRLDLWVLAQTAKKMLGVGRLVHLHDVPSWAIRGQVATETIDLREVIDLRSGAALEKRSAAVAAPAGN